MVQQIKDKEQEIVDRAALSNKQALRLYDRWVRQRQNRPSLIIPKDAAELKSLGLRNFVTQLIEPRKRHLEQLKEASKELTTADKVALLVMLEFPVLETSTLLHKLTAQLTLDPDATYFSKVNQDSNCGTGCGCGCAAMATLPYEERINQHRTAKPFSIDPFNEVGIPEKERDSLLIRDFLSSFESLSSGISERVNKRYFNMGREFLV